jgi:hypothetical protein
MNLPNDAIMSKKVTRPRVFRGLWIALIGIGLAFAAGFAVGHYGDVFPVQEAPPVVPDLSLNLAPIQMQLDRIEGLVTELSHRMPQASDADSPAPLSLSLLGSLALSANPSVEDKQSSKKDLILAKDLVDDLLFFFASQPLTSRDVDALVRLMENLFPEKKTDDLLILRSSYAHFLDQAEGLVLLPEPIVGTSDPSSPAPSSFWSGFLGHFVTVRGPGALNADDASAVPEVVGVYNDAYDAWQNTILPALRKGRPDEAAEFVQKLDARALFADDARWQIWKQDFGAWLRSYLWLRSARMDMTRQMIQQMTDQAGSSAMMTPPHDASVPENPPKNQQEVTP